MENVPQLMGKSIYHKFKRELTEVGYKIADGVISCTDFGVRQKRRRLVMLGSLLGEIDMPKPAAKAPLFHEPSLKTVKQAIGHLLARRCNPPNLPRTISIGSSD